MCYQDVTHSGMLKRAQQRHERQLVGPNESRRKSSMNVNSDERSILTRSQTSPFSKDVFVYFCDCETGYRERLVNVRTFGAGESLCKAISLSHHEKLTVKMNTGLAAKDAHSVVIKYHKNCWSKNVSNVLRKPSSSSEINPISASEIAAKIEFLTMTEIALHNGKIATISELQSTFESILEENNVPDASCKRKVLKQLLQMEIPDIEFHKPKRVNESERVSVKKTRDEAIQLAEEQGVIGDSEMKTPLDAAMLLRKSIKKCKKWDFKGSLENVPDENIPMELYSFFRWVIQGPNNLLSAENTSLSVLISIQSATEEIHTKDQNRGLARPLPDPQSCQKTY